MAHLRFTTPNGVILNSDWGVQLDSDEGMGIAAAAIGGALSEQGGVWIVADNPNGPATASFLPVGTSIVAFFNAAVVPESIRSTAVTLGEVSPG